jgi:hypothetical protein
MELTTNVKTGDLKINAPEAGQVERVITKEEQVIGKEVVAPNPEPPKEDLVSRVSKVKVEEPKKEEPSNPFSLTREDWDKVQSDPSLKKYYQSMLTDYQKKTTELSEQRKEVERTKQSANWTPERIQQLLNDPTFVQAAQQVASTQNPPDSGLSDQEYSALTDKEKAQLTSMQQEVQTLKMQNWQMQQRQQDEILRNKYANYAPDIVDTTISKLVRNQLNASREDIWKVLDYDEAVKRAYQLGKQDKLSENTEKQQALSVEGFNATPQSEAPKIEQGESNSNFFKRIALKRLAESKGQNR